MMESLVQAHATLHVANLPIELLDGLAAPELSRLAVEIDPDSVSARELLEQAHEGELLRQRALLYRHTVHDARFGVTLLLARPELATRLTRASHLARTRNVRSHEATLYRLLADAVSATQPDGLWCSRLQAPLLEDAHDRVEARPQPARVTPALAPCKALLVASGKALPAAFEDSFALLRGAEALLPPEERAPLRCFRDGMRTLCNELERELGRGVSEGVSEALVLRVRRAHFRAGQLHRRLESGLHGAQLDLTGLLHSELGAPFSVRLGHESRARLGRERRHKAEPRQLSGGDVARLAEAHGAQRYAVFCSLLAERRLSGRVLVTRAERSTLVVASSPLAIAAALEGLSRAEDVSVCGLEDGPWLRGPEGHHRVALARAPADCVSRDVHPPE